MEHISRVTFILGHNFMTIKNSFGNYFGDVKTKEDDRCTFQLFLSNAFHLKTSYAYLKKTVVLYLYIWITAYYDRAYIQFAS